jgi:tRNA A37 threonylcarbamoyladenosine dehydratase
MDDFSRAKREELLRAHREEMRRTESGGACRIRILRSERVQKAVERYAGICAEYAACKGISACYRAAGMQEKAQTFSAAAAIAAENARAVDGILAILEIEHTEFEK